MKNLHILKAVLLAVTVGLFAGSVEAEQIQFYATANCNCTLTAPDGGVPYELKKSESDLLCETILIYDSDGYNSTHANDVTGYAFKGWYTMERDWSGQETPKVGDCTKLIKTLADLTYSDVTESAKRWSTMSLVFAKYVPVYKITAVADPASAGTVTIISSPAPVNGRYEKDSMLTLTASATDAAHQISYWMKDGTKVAGSDGQNSIAFTATANAAYTAVFSKKTYTVTFKDPSTTYSDDVQTVEHGQSAKAPDWSRKGFALSWDRSFSSITADTTVTAKWTAEQYTVTFHDPSGAHTDVVRTVGYGQPATAPSWSRTGYENPTWDKSFSNVTANMTVTAQWTPETYTITYSGLKQGAVNTNQTTYTIESDEIVFQEPTAVVGYKFNGWDPASIPEGSTGDKTVKAAYLETVDKPIITPELTYNGSLQACATTDSRIQASNNQKTIPGKYTATFLPKAGYCWSDGTVSEVSANWEIVNADITGAKVVQSGTLTYNGEPQQANVSAQATVAGSQAKTWKYSTSQGNYDAAMPSFTDAGTHSVYFEVSAQYHNPAYGSFDVVINRAKTAKVELSKPSFSYTGLEQGPQVTFTHCTEALGSVKTGTNVGTYVIKATPDENYAWSDGGTATREFEWKIEEARFTATVAAGEGGSGGSTFGYWTKQEAQTEHIYSPTRTGYQVSNWNASGFVGEAPTVSGDRVTIPARTAGNFTLTPIWTPITYTVAFDGNGGEGSMPSVPLAYDEPYEVPSCDFTKTGCEFQRWQVLIDNRAVTNYTAGTVVSNLTATANKTVTFKAVWTSYYTIAFDGNGATNTVMATQVVERDVETNLTDNAYVRLGYSFLGWEDAVNKKRYEDGAAVMNIADVGATNTLKAVWSTNSYTVVFFGNGGTNTMESQGFAYDVPQKLRPNAFIRTGYTFVGWALDPVGDVVFTDGQEVSNLSAEDKDAVALYARWSSTGSLTNPYSIAADCDKTDATGVALELTPDDRCSVVSKASDAFGEGNDQYVKLMPIFDGGHAVLSVTLAGKGLFSFRYRVLFPVYPADTGDAFILKVGSSEELKVTQEVDEWTERTYEKTSDGDMTLTFDMAVEYGDDGDYALVDFIKWDPQPRDQGTVGVTFRLEDGSVFSNLTVVAGASIGALPVPVDADGRQFLGWTYQGSSVDSTWIVPASDDGVRLDVQWESGEHPVPVDGEDNVIVSAAAVSADGKSFTLSFQSDARFDYNLLTNANLLIDRWGIMETKPGDGDILTFEPEVLEGEPQMFYKVETIRRQ